MKEKFFCFGKNGFCDQSNDDVDRCRKCKHYDGSGGDLRMQEKPPRLDREAWEPCRSCGSKCRTCLRNETSRCNKCNNYDCYYPVGNFCAYCGRPLTDAAWEMLEKRLEGIA